MDTLIKTTNEIKQKMKIIRDNFIRQLECLPDFSKFSDEQQKEMREKYIQDLQQRALIEYDSLSSDISIKSKLLQQNINKAKYPLESSAIGSDEKLQVEMIRQRADNLALSKLDWQILNYLDNEISKNNIDFIGYFSDSVKLNTGIDNELRASINLKLSEVEKSTGINKIKTEIKICEVLMQQSDLYKKITEDNNPVLKIESGTYENELSQLENQLEA
jgi:hypothetical protein